MALGKSGSYNSGPLIFLGVGKSKDAEGNPVKPHFTISRKGADGKITKSGETVDRVSGDLIKLEVGEWTYQGNVNKEAKLYLRDSEANETYQLKLTFTMASRSLFNSLASLDSFEALSISIYENAKGYQTFSLRQNDEKTNWKFKLEELPEPICTQHKGKTLRDWAPVEELFVKELEVIAAKIGNGKADEAPAAPAAKPKAVAKTSAKPAPVAATQEELDDQSVPF